MNSKLKKILVSALVTLVIGGVIGASLFHFSDKFFDIKTLQTQVSGGFIGSDKGSMASTVIPRGAKVPEVEGVEIRSGENVKLSDLDDKIVILNFWASWCEPCLDEFPSFASLLKEVGDDFVFIGVSQDKAKDDANSFLKAFGKELEGVKAYFIHDDKKAFANKFGVLALPETFIISPKQTLIHRVSGFENWNSKKAVEFFRRLQKENLSEKVSSTENTKNKEGI